MSRSVDGASGWQNTWNQPNAKCCLASLTQSSHEQIMKVRAGVQLLFNGSKALPSHCTCTFMCVWERERHSLHRFSLTTFSRKKQMLVYSRCCGFAFWAVHASTCTSTAHEVELKCRRRWEIPSIHVINLTFMLVLATRGPLAILPTWVLLV